jgi:hypothetical protein
MKLPDQLKQYLRDQNIYLISSYTVKKLSIGDRLDHYTGSAIKSGVIHYEIHCQGKFIVIELNQRFNSIRIIKNDFIFD